MLTIRREQREAFRAYMRQAFEERLIRHVAAQFPARCRALGIKRVQERVHYGVDVALCYGLKSKRDVSRYINLMFTLGPDFDSDQRLPWAARILEDEFLAPPDKMNVLYRKAYKYFRRVRTEKGRTVTNLTPEKPSAA